MAMNVQQLHSMQMYKSTQSQTEFKNNGVGEQIRQNALQMHATQSEKSESVITNLFGGEKSPQTIGLQVSFQAAVDAINQKLREDLGLDASAKDSISAEKLQQQGMEYWTPENTSQRLVDGAMGFLPAFQNAHPELTGEALQDKFMEVVGGGLTQGFNEARSFLDDNNVLTEEIAGNIDSTYSLMQNGLQQRLAEALGLNSEEELIATTAEMEVKVDAD